MYLRLCPIPIPRLRFPISFRLDRTLLLNTQKHRRNRRTNTNPRSPQSSLLPSLLFFLPLPLPQHLPLRRRRRRLSHLPFPFQRPNPRRRPPSTTKQPNQIRPPLLPPS